MQSETVLAKFNTHQAVFVIVRSFHSILPLGRSGVQKTLIALVVNVGKPEAVTRSL